MMTDGEGGGKKKKTGCRLESNRRPVKPLSKALELSAQVPARLQ